MIKKVFQKLKYFKLKLFLKEKLFNPVFEYTSNFFTDNESRKNFLTYHQRPIYAKNFGLWSSESKDEPQTAIILQGRIVDEFDFTLETIKIYKKLFPRAIIILSLREDEDKKEVLKIQNENITIVFHKLPDNFGPGNINLQLLSSINGIQKAKELGAEYVIKTRTDQRMYAPDSLNFLRNIIETFPIQGNGIQKKRIVGVSLNTYKYRPYSLSDMTIYSHIDDMLLYWGADLDNRVLNTKELTATLQQSTKAGICEVYLVTEFIKKLGYIPKMSIADSWYVFAKYFCVVDQISLDLYWHKYTRHAEHKTLEYDAMRSSSSLTFSEWLNLYANINNIGKAPEKLLDKPLGAIIIENSNE